MSEPTKEAIEEAIPLLLGHAVECPDGMVMSAVGLAHIIAHVRKQAREDALEEAIVTGGIWVQAAYIAQFNASLRVLKTQGDTQ